MNRLPTTSSAQPPRLRVGAVSYLNTKPLVYGLGAGTEPGIELVFDLPSRLADRLAAAELDVALIPSLEFFHHPGYTIVSDACIACRGPVLSVKLLSRRPIPEIRTLALDEGSRTSAALVQILLKQQYGLQPQLEPLPMDVEPAAVDTDAVLLIGDRAIHPPEDGFVDIWDIGDRWCRWSELPCVFAMWVSRERCDASRLEPVLASARDAGTARLPEIARDECTAAGLDEAACLSYLRDNLYFFLGPREQQGLELFYRHAVEMGLAPRGSAELNRSGSAAACE